MGSKTISNSTTAHHNIKLVTKSKLTVDHKHITRYLRLKSDTCNPWETTLTVKSCVPVFFAHVCPHLKVKQISTRMHTIKLTLKHQSSEYLYESFLILSFYFSSSEQLQLLPLLTNHLTSSKQEKLKAKQFVKFNLPFNL